MTNETLLDLNCDCRTKCKFLCFAIGLLSHLADSHAIGLLYPARCTMNRLNVNEAALTDKTCSSVLLFVIGSE